uniref:Uncharacterized protein n=1 Tax=Arundo donax TaxID=35708 RepID=A0A0A9HAT6_ARUDO
MEEECMAVQLNSWRLHFPSYVPPRSLVVRSKFGLQWHMRPIGGTRIALHCTKNWRVATP